MAVGLKRSGDWLAARRCDQCATLPANHRWAVGVYCHCCGRNSDYLNWFCTRNCGAGRPHVGLCLARLVIAIISSFGLHLSKIHSRCYTNRQRRRVRRRLNMSVINTGGGAHWTGGRCGGTPTSCYLWAGSYVQTAKFWREKLGFFPK